jgi:protoporphyrinogen oxidase
MLSIAIVGGGPGGLVTAYRLERGTDFPLAITLFEASNRVGGKIVTRRFDTAPVSYEAGVAELYDYSQLGPDPLRELVAELGLATSPLQGETVILGDRVLRTKAEARRVLGGPTSEALERFNRQARSLISPAEYYEQDWNRENHDPLACQSFHSLLARVPDEAARRYIEAVVHSDLATEPHLTSALYGLENYLVNEPDYLRLYTIDGGIESLPHELARRLASSIRLEHRVVRIERTPEGRYRVFTRHRGETTGADFDYVVVALPNDWLPGIEWGGAALAEAMHRHHTRYYYPGHYLRVSVLFDRPFWRDLIAESYFMPDALGGCCVYDESSRVRGHGFGVLGWLLAGDAALTMSNLDDTVLIERVLDSLPHGRQWFREGQVHRWVGTVSGLPGGHPVREPRSCHRPEPAGHPRLFVVGDYLFDSTINGVLDSAELVTDWILEEIEAGVVGPAVPTAAAGNGSKPAAAGTGGPVLPDKNGAPEAARRSVPEVEGVSMPSPAPPS